MNEFYDLVISLEQEEQTYNSYDILDPFSDTHDW